MEEETEGLTTEEETEESATEEEGTEETSTDAGGFRLSSVRGTVSGTSALEIVSWEWVDEAGTLEGDVLTLSDVTVENQMDFDSITAMLPQAILAEVGGEIPGRALRSRTGRVRIL